MKNLKFLTVLITATIVALGSCTSDDGSPNPQQPGGDPTIMEFSLLTVGNQKNTTVGCFIDLDKGTIYTLQQAFQNQALIDMVFYHDAPTNDPWLGCPAELSYFTTYDLNIETDPQYGVNQWATKNPVDVSNTDISVGTFDAIHTALALNTAFNDDSHTMIGAQPSVEGGKVYKFKTNTGRIGLINVKSIDGNASTSGKMIIDLKVMK